MSDSSGDPADGPAIRARAEELGVPVLDGELWLFEMAARLIRLENTVLRAATPSVTLRQFRLLRRVAEGYVTPTAIADRSTLSLPTISRSLDALVQKSLVRRRIQSHDRRSYRLAITPEGERVLADSRRILGVLAARLTESLPDRRREELLHDVVAINRQVTGLLRAG